MLRNLRRARAVRRRDFEYVFVVTYGRSGSTLVQGLLNTIPRTLVRGENSLYLLQLFRAQEVTRTFREQRRKGSGEDASSAFYGLHEIELDAFARSAGDLTTDQLLGRADARDVDVLGFKEVLWHQVTTDETERFFEFLDDAFNRPRYVLNQRDHDEVVGSGFWQRVEEREAHAAIARVEEIQQFLRDTRPDRVLDLRYERITSDDSSVSDHELRSLATFVSGACDEPLLRAMRETLTHGHGPNPFGKSRAPGLTSRTRSTTERGRSASR